MRIWFDTEFLENGRTIELISIGLVREDGETWYAETPNGAELAASDPWLKANVLPHLKGSPCVAARKTIARDIISFSGLTRGEKPEFWAYYADYDWVAFCQLYGRMIDLPKGYPMFCRDIKQWCADLGNPKLPEQASAEHDALADALWNKTAWEFLSALPNPRSTRMTESMVERVARAMCVEGKMNPDDAMGGWVHWEPEARAAIQAVRDSLDGTLGRESLRGLEAACLAFHHREGAPVVALADTDIIAGAKAILRAALSPTKD